MDGVLIDHTQNKICLASIYGFHLEPWETPPDIMRKKIPADIYAKIQHTLYGDASVLEIPPLMKDVPVALNFLQNQNIPCMLISRRKNPEIAVALLEHHQLVPQYFSRDALFFVEKPADKNEQARKLNITHYLDDEVHVLSLLPDVAHRILFDPHGVFSSSQEYGHVCSFQEFISSFRSQEL